VSTLLRSVVIAGALAAPLAATAATPAAKGPTLSDVLGASGITLSGAVDASYDWDDVDGPPSFHAFDVTPEGFALHQVNVLATKTFDNGVGITLNPVFGDDANLLGYGDLISPLLGAYGSNNDDFDLLQGYVSYAAGPMTTIFGRFTTLAGYEVVNPAGNLNASRSLLFFQQPLAHAGLRSTMKAGDALAFTFGLVNSSFGTNKTDNNSDVTVEAQAAFTPSSAVAVYLTGYTGNEDATGIPPYGLTGILTAPVGGAIIRTDIVDLVTSVALGDAVTVALNADYIRTEGATSGSVELKGVAAYANAKFGAFRIAPRVEYIEIDNPGAGEGVGWQREGTLTFGYALTEAAELIAEVRQDVVDDGVFALPTRDAGDPNPNNDQTTATLKAIVKF
jgi:hypothetical protein